MKATFHSTTTDQLISVRRSSATSLRNSISEPALPTSSPPSRRTHNHRRDERIEGTPPPRVAPQSPDRVETMQRTMREQNLAKSPLPARLRGTDRLSRADRTSPAGTPATRCPGPARRTASGRSGRRGAAPPPAGASTARRRARAEDAEVSAALAKAPPLDAAAVTPPATTRTRRRGGGDARLARAPTPEELDRVRLMARLEDSLSPPPAERVAAGGRASPPGPALARRASSGFGRSIEAHGSMHGSATSTDGRRARPGLATRGRSRREPDAVCALRRAAQPARSSRRARADASSPTRRRRWRWARRGGQRRPSPRSAAATPRRRRLRRAAPSAAPPPPPPSSARRGGSCWWPRKALQQSGSGK